MTCVNCTSRDLPMVRQDTLDQEIVNQINEAQEAYNRMQEMPLSEIYVDAEDIHIDLIRPYTYMTAMEAGVKIDHKYKFTENGREIFVKYNNILSCIPMDEIIKDARKKSEPIILIFEENIIKALHGTDFEKYLNKQNILFMFPSLPIIDSLSFDFLGYAGLAMIRSERDTNDTNDDYEEI